MSPQPAPPPDASADQSPLSEAQRQELAAAIGRGRKVLGAAKVAAFTGWTVGFFGVLSVLLGFMSPTGLLVGAALLVVAWNELEGRKMLRAFDPAGPKRLAANQLWLLAVIAVYCLWSIYQARVHPDAELSQLEALMDLGEGFVAGLTTMAYGSVLVVAAIFQYVMYRYHAARIPMVREYVAETPTWIVEIQRLVEGGPAPAVRPLPPPRGSAPGAPATGRPGT